MSAPAPLDVCYWLWLVWGIYWALSARGAAPMAIVESRAQRLGHLVPTVVAIWLLLWPAHGGVFFSVRLPVAVRWAGALLAILGFAVCVWARVHLGRYWSAEVALKQGHQLVRTGPYALARHPIYTGFLAAILGTAIAGASTAGLLAVGLAVAAYWRKLQREDVLLAGRFGADYESYRREVGALWPRWRH